MTQITYKKRKVNHMDGLIYLALTEYESTGSVQAANYAIKMAGEQTAQAIELLIELLDNTFDDTNLEFTDACLFSGANVEFISKFKEECLGSFSEWVRQNYDDPAEPPTQSSSAVMA